MLGEVASDDMSLEGRVGEVARLATEHGHMAEVVPAGEGAYAIKQHNCPIADVAGLTGHPCQAEQALYRRLLGADVGVQFGGDDRGHVESRPQPRVSCFREPRPALDAPA